MARYKIVRIYEVPGRDRIEATNRLLEALELGTQRDYHVNDLVRSVDDPPGRNRQINLTRSKSWTELLLEQLLGK